MFEKEAEERTKQFIKTHSESDEFINCKRETDNYNVTLAQGYELGFKDGADYGYNKANEWRYVKDGDLPKDEEWKWCISRRGYPYVAKYEELFVSWRNQENKDVMCPYAWKEIVPPKESE